jgi:hypothetical protein
MYEHTAILPRVQQHTLYTSVLCMYIQLYYLVYNVYNNTHRLHLFYICVSNYIASRRTTHIVYICFMYEYATLLPRVQRVEQHTSSTSVLCMSIQNYYLEFNV